jgi:protein ImuB
MRRILALNLPRFSVDRLRRPSGERPLLLAESVQGSHWVAACSDAAAARGVRAGMSLAHARALLGEPEPAVEPFDPGADQRALEELGGWAARFSPLVALAEPSGLLLDVTGSERLFGDEVLLTDAVVDALCARGLRARGAVAGTIGCAWAVASFGVHPRTQVAPGDESRALSDLPVEALRLEAETVDALREVGVERVAHLFELARSELPARFGPDLLLRLDQARGQAFESFVPLRVVPPLSAVHEFEEPVKLVVVQHVLRALLERLTGELHERGEGARCVELRIDCAETRPFEDAIVLSRPSRDLEHVWALLGPRLDRVQLGFGALRLSLCMPSPVSMPALQANRWDRGGETPEELGRLFDTLAVRLGAKRVLAVDPVESHLPEHAFRRRSATTSVGDAALTPLARPSRLFTPPHPVNVETSADGAPVQLRWRGALRRIVRRFGPERLTPPWWGNAQGTRDYFRVEDEHGGWLWLLCEADGRWFVHGEWA